MNMNYFEAKKIYNDDYLRKITHHNAEVLAEHSDKALYSGKHGKIKYHSNWNLLGRLIEFIKDPFSTKLKNSIFSTLNKMIDMAENDKDTGYVSLSPKTWNRLTGESSNRRNYINYGDLMDLLYYKERVKYLSPLLDKDNSPILILHNATFGLRQTQVIQLLAPKILRGENNN